MRSYYEILGVAATASRDEIRRAYLAGARRLHPDTGAGDQRGMQVLNEAWTVLRDPRRRGAYDRTLGLPTETPRASPAFVPLAFLLGILTIATFLIAPLLVMVRHRRDTVREKRN